MAIVYLNGGFLDEENASVSVLDRGFLFGDGIYEVIPAYGGQLFRFDEHFDRLEQSLAAVQITNPYSKADWNQLLLQLITKNGGGDLSIYVQVTRGVAKREHTFDKGMTPTAFMMATPLEDHGEDRWSAGIKAVVLDDIRWKQCHIKSIALLPNVLLKQQALEVGADEAILIRDGKATEGAASNLFMVSHGVAITPPTGPQLLPGITRDLILELMRANGVVCEEREIGVEELYHAEEIWLTSSTKEIMPVTMLDDKPVSGGEPGKLWREVSKIYQNYKRAIRDGIKRHD